VASSFTRQVMWLLMIGAAARLVMTLIASETGEVCLAVAAQPRRRSSFLSSSAGIGLRSCCVRRNLKQTLAPAARLRYGIFLANRCSHGSAARCLSLKENSNVDGYNAERYTYGYAFAFIGQP
jgi:hypothetical protein